MAHHPRAPFQPVTLRLPAGERYCLELSSGELAALLAEGRRPPRQGGMSPIHVDLDHGGGRAVVPLSPGELTRLLSRARLEADADRGYPAQPEPLHDPLKGRGVHDPAAHRG